MFRGFYKGKRVLVTGHTGFKGGWLSLWLHKLGASVWGVSLPAPTNPNLHEVLGPGVFVKQITCDIRDLQPLAEAVGRAQPDIVFHLAAQPLVRRSYAEPLETLETNVVGTANLLEAVRLEELGCVVVVVTSDKCYENREWEFAYRENDPVGGHDVYSMSKGAAELVAASWRKSFFEPNPKLGPVATARAGNVIGGGDYAEDRIVPDCVRALMKKEPLVVRNPAAVRPWQHVLECISGYLWLGALLGTTRGPGRLASAFNFGPEPSSRQSVRKLVEELFRTWPGEWSDGSEPGGPHEAKLLSLSIEKAGALLGWYPCWGFGEAVQRTMAWYRERHDIKNANMLEFSWRQVDEYVEAAAGKKLRWALDDEPAGLGT